MESFLKFKKELTDSKDETLIKQADNIWSMLDDMASRDPASYKKFIEKTMNEGREAMKPPEPHMCVKSYVNRPEKYILYINLFGWTRIPAPKTDDDPIPVYGSTLEENKTKNPIVNLAFNNQVLEKYGRNSENPLERDMLIKLAFNYVQNQNKLELDIDKYEIVSDLTYYGNLEDCVLSLTKNPKTNKNVSQLELAKDALESLNKSLPDQVITKLTNLDITNENKPKKDEKKPLIEELDIKPPQPPPQPAQPIHQSQTKEATKIPIYEEKPIDETTNTQHPIYEVKIHLQNVNSMSECDLEVENDYLILNTPIYKQLKISISNLRLKYQFTNDDVEAKFYKKNSILRVRIKLNLKE